jgi:transposase
MLIIGCDYHPGFQQIAFVDTDTGEAAERRLTHREEAEQFYRTLEARRVRIGMEASGHGRWFERLLNELQFELWIGDAAEIRTKRVRKQKTDRQDAQLLLKLLMEDRFPRIWVPDWVDAAETQMTVFADSIDPSFTAYLYGIPAIRCTRPYGVTVNAMGVE